MSFQFLWGWGFSDEFEFRIFYNLLGRCAGFLLICHQYLWTMLFHLFYRGLFFTSQAKQYCSDYVQGSNARTVISPPLPALFLPSSLISCIQSVPCPSSKGNFNVVSKSDPQSLPPKRPKDLSMMCLPSSIAST